MSRPSRLSLILPLLVLGILRAAPADDPPQSDASDWAALVARKAETLGRLQEIRQTLESPLQRPSRAEAEQMIEEYNSLLTDLRESLYPQMTSSAMTIFEQDTLSEEDADQIADLAVRLYRQNRFQQAAALADGVLDRFPEHAVALNAGGAAHFALHEFERSAELLATADELETIIPNAGGKHLEFAAPYIEYWKHEQALRAAEASAIGDEVLPRVQLRTSRGDILLELFENEAPNTVANFVSLVERGYYDGTKFHRVIPEFMAQGGDPNTREGASGQPGTGGPGYLIDCECYQPNARRHFAGSISMAHAGRDTGGSQFFITHLPTPHLDADVVPESVHTVFGRVVEGMDVVLDLEKDDVIESATVIRKRNHDYIPETTPVE